MLLIALSGTFNQFSDQVKTFNWHSPSWDLFIILAWLVVSVIYAFTSGKGRIINILVSVYIAKLLTIQAPFLGNAISGKLPNTLASLQQLVVFVIIFIVLFIFLGRYAFRTSVDGRNMVGSLIFSLIFAVLQIGLLINIIMALLPLNLQNNFSPLIRIIFLGSTSGFVWLISPLVYLILVGKFISDSKEL